MAFPFKQAYFIGASSVDEGLYKLYEGFASAFFKATGSKDNVELCKGTLVIIDAITYSHKDVYHFTESERRHRINDWLSTLSGEIAEMTGMILQGVAGYLGVNINGSQASDVLNVIFSIGMTVYEEMPVQAGHIHTRHALRIDYITPRKIAEYYEFDVCSISQCITNMNAYIDYYAGVR